jgi:hypothetical protein
MRVGLPEGHDLEAVAGELRCEDVPRRLFQLVGTHMSDSHYGLA